MVVQWKLPQSLSSFVQRAARSSGHTGKAVLLVERPVYSLDQHETVVPKGSRKKSNAEPSIVVQAKRRKERTTYAQKCGVLRGDYEGQHDSSLWAVEPALDEQAEDEGLTVFVQTDQCRRKFLQKVFESRDTSKH